MLRIDNLSIEIGILKLKIDILRFGLRRIFGFLNRMKCLSKKNKNE